MKNLLVRAATALLLFASLTATGTVTARSQAASPVSVQCGSVTEGEFAKEFEDQMYAIKLAPGDTFTALVQPVGQHLQINVTIYDPAREQIGYSNNYSGSIKEVSLGSGVLSARGANIIKVQSHTGVGVYTLSISCKLRDGTVIKPGEATPMPASPSNEGAQVQPKFSGNGFPGLPAVDFSNVAKLPFPMGVPMGGAITPTGSEILGYTLDAKANDVLDLTFTRLSGNLNLGLVVLSADNKIIFQTGLVTSKTLATQLIFPAEGQYIIGIFRIDLLPPAKPKRPHSRYKGN